MCYEEDMTGVRVRKKKLGEEVKDRLEVEDQLEVEVEAEVKVGKGNNIIIYLRDGILRSPLGHLPVLSLSLIAKILRRPLIIL